MQPLYFCSFARAIAPISAQHQLSGQLSTSVRHPRIKSDSDLARSRAERAAPPADSRRLKLPRMQKYADPLSELVVGGRRNRLNSICRKTDGTRPLPARRRRLSRCFSAPRVIAASRSCRSLATREDSHGGFPPRYLPFCVYV